LPEQVKISFNFYEEESSMKIAIIGATGGTGRSAVEQALAQGHSVKALARTPSKLDLTHPDLEIIEGNVLNAADVTACLEGTEAVIVALGNTPNNPDLVVTDGTRNVIAGMRALGIRRLIAVTSLGVGDSKDQVPFFFRTLMRTVLRKAMEDKEQQEQLIRASGLDWIIVRPGGLTNGPFTGRYTAGAGRDISAGQVARADVADFLLKQLTDDTYLHQTPAIT
jgi:putative NADH-flavin reductase